MTEAQAALEAVRAETKRISNSNLLYDPSYEWAVLAALENLHARLKALEEK